MFANMYAAYDALSPGMQRLLDGLRAVNSSALADVSKTREDRIRDSGDDATTASIVAEHPVVRTHPETGRKALYVNVAHTLRFVDMTEDESRPLLRYLFEHSVRPEFTCRFQWQRRARSRCGTTAARCTTRSTTTTATRGDAPHHASPGDVPAMSAVRSEVTWPTIPGDGPRRRAPRAATPRRSSTATGGSTSPTLRGAGRRRGARASLASGIERGDRVAVWAPNSLEWIVAALGVTTAGGVLVPVNTRFKGAEAAYVLGAQRRPGAVHGPRVPRHRLPGAARRRRRRRSRRSSTRSCSPATPTTARSRWDDFLARGRRRADGRRSTRASRRSAPTTRATSCSRRARPAARRAS